VGPHSDCGLMQAFSALRDGRFVPIRGHIFQEVLVQEQHAVVSESLSLFCSQGALVELPRFSGQMKTVGISTEVRDSQW